MTIDEIEKAAKRAALDAAYKEMEHANVDQAVDAAIRAYDRAMLRPIEEAPERTHVLIYDGSRPFLAERIGDKWWILYCTSLGTFDSRPWKGRRPTHFRPLHNMKL